MSIVRSFTIPQDNIFQSAGRGLILKFHFGFLFFCMLGQPIDFQDSLTHQKLQFRLRYWYRVTSCLWLINIDQVHRSLFSQLCSMTSMPAATHNATSAQTGHVTLFYQQSELLFLLQPRRSSLVLTCVLGRERERDRETERDIFLN